MGLGSHIMLDCTEARGLDGRWMLSLMERAVDESGARRVHSPVSYTHLTLPTSG